MSCTRCKGTGRTKWCSSDKRITGPCPKCQPDKVAMAVRQHIERIWGHFTPIKRSTT